MDLSASSVVTASSVVSAADVDVTNTGISTERLFSVYTLRSGAPNVSRKSTWDYEGEVTFCLCTEVN